MSAPSTDPRPDPRQEIDRLIEAGDAAQAHALLGELWRRTPTPAVASFVVRRWESIRARLRSTPLRVAILRSFTVEPVVALLRAAGAVASLDLAVEIGGFGAFTQELLDPESAIYRARPDVAILALQTRDVAPELWDGFTARSEQEIGAAIDRGVAVLRGHIAAFRARSNAHLIVHNLEQPAHPGNGILDGRYESGQGESIRRINAELGRAAREQRGVYVLDYDGLVGRHGRLAWRDEGKWLGMRLPISSGCLLHLAREWLRFLHPLSGRICKVLVTDLDNTLWGGVVGEDGPGGIALGVEFPGAAYQAVQRTLLDLRRRGVLLAIASKNNPDDAEEVLARHPEMLLRPEHFAARRIGWGDKATALRELATELRVGLDALALLDDHPSERAWVRAQLPEVTVIEPGDDPLGFARAVAECPVFERLALSDEDRDRSSYYAADAQRGELSARAETVEDFYRSLDMEVEIAPLDRASLARVAQLTQKTNQFNVSGRRYSEQEIEQVASEPGGRVTWLRVRDRFGDHGLVGVAVTRRTGETCELEAFLLSCRVIGRTVETALLAVVARQAHTDGARRLAGWLRPTAKNAPAREFFAGHGFARVEEGEDGAARFALDLPAAIAIPPWFRVRADRQP